MKHTLVVIAAMLAGCATTKVAAPTTRVVGRATLVGREGEDSGHLYARLIARACAADETEHVVAQVEDFVDACKSDGQHECELAACDRLRAAAPRRCSDTVARIDWREIDREIALAALKADLELSLARNRP